MHDIPIFYLTCCQLSFTVIIMSNKQQYFFITGFEGPQREEMRKSIEQLNGILLENVSYLDRSSMLLFIIVM